MNDERPSGNFTDAAGVIQTERAQALEAERQADLAKRLESDSKSVGKRSSMTINPPEPTQPIQDPPIPTEPPIDEPTDVPPQPKG